MSVDSTSDLEIKKETREVFVYICPYCRKRIEALYYKQIKSLALRHLETHIEDLPSYISPDKARYLNP